MHGQYFPPIESYEIIGFSYFLLIIFLIVAIIYGLKLISPWFVSDPFMKGIAVASAILIVWEIIAQLKIVSSALLPTATKVFSNIVFMWTVGFLQPQIVATLFRLVYAFILAMVIAVPLGFLVSYFSKYFSPIESFINAARLIPSPAWLSLAILWFGIGHASAIFIIWLGCFAPIFLNTIAGVHKAEPVQVETVLTFGGNDYDVLREVMLPVSYHHILTGARIGLGIGWITVVTAELASVDIGAGIGWMIQDSRILLDTTTVLSGIIVLGLLGIIVDTFLKRFEGFVQGWS